MAEIIDTRRDDALLRAAQVLKSGQPVAIPTETVYGLAADATNPEAIARIYEIKGRPRFNPLIAHVADLAMARAHVVFDPISLRLAEAFWPGPLTLILPLLPTSTVHRGMSSPVSDGRWPHPAPTHPAVSARQMLRMWRTISAPG